MPTIMPHAVPTQREGGGLLRPRLSVVYSLETALGGTEVVQKLWLSPQPVPTLRGISTHLTILFHLVHNALQPSALDIPNMNLSPRNHTRVAEAQVHAVENLSRNQRPQNSAGTRENTQGRIITFLRNHRRKTASHETRQFYFYVARSACMQR